jgi:hypothetical protein
MHLKNGRSAGNGAYARKLKVHNIAERASGKCTCFHYIHACSVHMNSICCVAWVQPVLCFLPVVRHHVGSYCLLYSATSTRMFWCTLYTHSNTLTNWLVGWLADWLPNHTEQSPSWEADSRSFGQETDTFMKPEDYKIRILVIILSHTILYYTILYYTKPCRHTLFRWHI